MTLDMYHYVGRESESFHTCEGLMDENRRRALMGEGNVYIFVDYESCKFNIKIGLEFIAVQYCPFCSEELCEDK